MVQNQILATKTYENIISRDWFYLAVGTVNSKFREFYRENSIDITPDNFLSDFFCLCFNLSNLPILDGDSAIVLKPEDRVLAFVEGGTLDAIVEFSSPLKENTMIFFQGVYDLVSSFDADGLIVQ